MIESVPFSPAGGRNLYGRLALRRALERSGHNATKGANRIMSECDWLLAPLLGLALKAAGLYRRGVRNALNVQVRQHRLAFPGLPESVAGFRILHISDLHLDGMDGLADVLCKRLSGLRVDLCVLTGDYRFKVAGPHRSIYPRLRNVLRMVRSRLGVAGILGNHDCADMVPELERLGIRMLINESMEVAPGFWVTGADEVDGGRGFRQALPKLPRDAFHVALVHTPQLYAECAAAGVHLYLCGHTHGGQICLPGGWAPIMNARCPRQYARGLWQHGQMVGSTSRGAGSGLLPVRYNCPPEITVFELARA